jgi:hypothetical protein
LLFCSLVRRVNLLPPIPKPPCDSQSKVGSRNYRKVGVEGTAKKNWRIAQQRRTGFGLVRAELDADLCEFLNSRRRPFCSTLG